MSENSAAVLAESGVVRNSFDRRKAEAKALSVIQRPEFKARYRQLITMSEWMKKSPLEWEEYVYKEVRVIANEKEYKGWLLTTDPVSANVVLVNFLEDDSLSVTGIMGHSVQTVETVTEGDHRVREKLMHLFTSGDCKGYSPEDLEKRKNSLKKWLEKNHIPITEKGDTQRTLCVAGVLTIDPPYGPENCSSSNEIILSRIQDLIQGHLSASQQEAKNYEHTD